MLLSTWYVHGQGLAIVGVDPHSPLATSFEPGDILIAISKEADVRVNIRGFFCFVLLCFCTCTCVCICVRASSSSSLSFFSSPSPSLQTLTARLQPWITLTTAFMILRCKRANVACHANTLHVHAMCDCVCDCVCDCDSVLACVFCLCASVAVCLSVNLSAYLSL